ncbi:MAG: type II secretion system F family protein [Candidatus Eisenbacteria bacterium]|uniref:Type II secretion system F family protein n=1 Tax=Eiseniibacteriota bacterium TaxID=2212470 RepID=A0A538SXZ8_UNCEI|nr:MAG: type II secretion system F family protein [Candidatus Eisenbacteria bacterium]
METVIFSLLLFLAVSLAAYAVWSQVATARDPVAARLRQIRASHTSGGARATFGERPDPLLELLARLGGFLPAREGRDVLRTGLVKAGFRRPEAVAVFLGCKIACAVLVPLAWISIASVIGRPLGSVALWTVITAAAGFYLPSAYVSLRQKRRQLEIMLALPDALDLLVVCVEAGLGIAAAIQRVAEEIAVASPALSVELALVNQEMQAGVARFDALRGLARRTGVDELYALVAMLIQTDRLGTSVADALRAHAQSMRTRRRQRAELLARQAGAKLAFPLVLLILPALLVVILGPAAIQITKALVSGD